MNCMYCNTPTSLYIMNDKTLCMNCGKKKRSPACHECNRLEPSSGTIGLPCEHCLTDKERAMMGLLR